MGAMQAVELEPESGGVKATGENPSPPDSETRARIEDRERAAAHSDTGWDVRFAALAEEHSRFLFRIAYGLLRNAHDAEDAVQEALLRIYRAGMRAGGAEIADEKAYFARTVWRTGLDIAARRPKRTESLEGDGSGDGAGAGPRRELAAAGRSAEEELAEDDERAQLRRLIDGLPEELSQPLVLSAIEEMTSRGVAAALGIPEGTVRTRVMRARAELRKRFEAIRKKTKATADSHG